MQIKTEYDIGEQIYLLFDNKIICGFIKSIHIDVIETPNSFNIDIKYKLYNKGYVEINDTMFKQHKLFRTKEKLIDNLLKNS